MGRDRLSRKLAVILHADVVGSTSLVQKDEAIAHQRIRDAFDNFSETINAYGGVAHEIRGDALVAQFERASDAVSAAMAFQDSNASLVATLNDDIKPELRVGISLGEVVIADNTITGAGVVVAQRLEQLAEPGAVVVQGSVADTVPSRMPFEYVSLGDHILKGIDKPVGAFRVALDRGEDIPSPEGIKIEAAIDGEDYETLRKPSIAVLAFTNMSNNPEQEFFADGISEDIITALSKISALMVVARNSSFVYKGTPKDIKQIGNELGVRYVLEGSVRRAGERIRVTAQLIDTSTGNHLWAERYDRNLEDVFSVQDEITRQVVNALDVELVLGEQARLWAGGTQNLEAWESIRLALDLVNRQQDQLWPQVKQLMTRALELDPEYAFAWAMYAGFHIHVADSSNLTAAERREALELVREYAEKALELDPTAAKSYSHLGLYHLNKQEYDEAEQCAQKAAELAVNQANDLAIAAMINNKCGKPERALKQIQKAMRLSPVHPMWLLTAFGQILRILERFDESINVFLEMTQRDPEHIEGHIGLAQVLGQLDRIDEAKKAATEVLRIDPEFSAATYLSSLSYRDQKQISLLEHGLKRAGLPD